VALCDTARNPQQRVVAMFDMTGGAMANMDVAGMRSILGLLSTHYVERLSALYFYDPPRIFFGLWNASKHLVPEVTRNKIKMIDPSDLAELQACVPADVLPTDFGGAAVLRPIAEACRHFKLPPFDGRLARAGSDVEGSEAEGVDARLVVGEEEGAGKEGVEGLEAAVEGLTVRA